MNNTILIAVAIVAAAVILKLLSASLWFCPKTSGLKLRSQDGSGAVD
jgi:hypothetical protein